MRLSLRRYGTNLVAGVLTATGITVNGIVDILSTGFAKIRSYTTSDTAYPQYFLYRSRASETATQSGDVLGTLSFRGHDGTSYISSSSAEIRGIATENQSGGSNNGGGLSFHTTVNAGSFAERIRFDNTGYIGVGETSPTALVDINESSTTRASLRLRHGTAPSSPQDGDMWTTTSGLYVRINGSTVGPLS